MSLKKIFGVLLSLCVLITTMGCGGIASSSSPNTPSGTGGSPVDVEQATLNLINANTDGVPVDVYLNGKLAAGVDFRAATGLIKVDVGRVRVDVRVKGAAATSLPLISTDVDIDVRARVSLALVGRISLDLDANIDVDAKLRLVVLGAASSDSASVKLRVLHASPSAPLLDIAADARIVARAVAFAKVSAYAALDADLAAGTRLGLRLGGLDVDAALAATLLLHKKGSVLTAIAIGEIIPTCDDDKFLGISILDELTGELINLNLSINVNGPKASFYLFHGVADLGAIDLALKAGAVLHTNLGFQKASPILQVSAGILGIELRAAAKVLLGLNLKLLPGTHWTLYTAGMLNAAASLGVNAKLALRAAVRLAANLGAHVRVLNLVVDVPAIDVLAGADVWARGLVFAKASAYVKLAANLPLVSLNVKVAASVVALLNTLITQTLLDASRDQAVTCFVTGAANATLGAAVQVVAVVESELGTLPLNCLTLPRL